MNATDQQGVAQLIRETRQCLNLSQVQFALKLGVSFQSVNRWENGRTKPLPLALNQIKQLLYQMSTSPEPTLRQRSRDLLTQYFSD
ncbi:Transcriptional regulator, XRE family [Planktothrix serta PCC 8927]|uniref:Transcriptional regulator, XRE family n=1 Tax=Planktothrix serta PCC 8927 TaxID=671068 RepID=A0A7Z9BX25_9CYAN|nr:helix-turn-helix transcriptional regulator [Planktothrix serta]VXD23131.1 Transcriptional regulator, XRE family [Planktothrix serta PCC 8927]